MMGIMSEYYRNGREYLADRVGVLKWRILKRIHELNRDERLLPKGRWKKLFTNQRELERMSTLPLEKGEQPAVPHVGPPNPYYPRETVLAELRKAEEELARKTQTTFEKGKRIAPLELQQSFALSDMEFNVLLLGIAGEIDTRILHLYHFVCSTMAEPSAMASTQLFFRIFADTPEKQLEYRKYLTIESSLIRYKLITVTNLDEDRMMSWQYTVPLPVVNCCLDLKTYQHQLALYAELIKPMTERYLSYFPEEDAREIGEAVGHYVQQTARGETGLFFSGIQRNGMLFLLEGQSGSGQRYLVESAAYRLGRNIFRMDFARIVRMAAPQELFILLFRDARLLDAVVYLENADLVKDKDFSANTNDWHVLWRLINEHPGVVFVASYSALDWDQHCEQKVVLRYQLATPSFQHRRQIWFDELAEIPHVEDRETCADRLALLFGLHVDGIKGAVRYACDKCFADGDRSRSITAELLIEGSRAQLNRGLAAFGSRVRSKLTWDHMVLPPETKSALNEILVNAKYRPTVLSDWGLEKRLGIGTGIGILFDGEPGTGKTMAAGIIASQLGKDLYKINVSTVISKWVGETEKQLQRVFTEAEESQSVILFDEADSLFSKRSTGDSQDSGDRFANMTVNFLLQKIEEFRGVCILTTNLKKSIDQAFIRRLAYRVTFPFPDEAARAKIWEGFITPEMPVGEGFDFDYLAKKYKVSGGHIKNCVLRAAFFAIDDDSKVMMYHLDKAGQKECKEIGALWDINMESPDKNRVPLSAP